MMWINVESSLVHMEHGLYEMFSCYIEAKVDEQNKVMFMVCGFVLLRELRPIEPFLTSYLNSPPLNFTIEEVNEVIYPMGTYSSLSLVVLVFLVTDYLRYKPIIILDGITGIFTYALIIGKPSLRTIMVEQWFFGFFFSSDVACNTYLYAKVEDTSHYQRITGYVRASSLVGRFISGIISQVTVSSKILEKSDLIYISTIGMVVVTIWAFFIPPVGHSIYFHRPKTAEIKGESNPSFVGNNAIDSSIDIVTEKTVVESEKLEAVMKRLWFDFKVAYTNMYVLKWSMWWALGLCGFYFVNAYSQVLWQITANEYGSDSYLMNGAVDAVYTITSASAAYFVSRLDIKWRDISDLVLAVTSFILSLLVIYNNISSSLWCIYASYILYGMIFQTMLTIAQSEVAKYIERDSYALIFGFNAFAALAVTGIFTFTIIEGRIAYFSTKQQFLFYGIYYALLGTPYLTEVLINIYGKFSTSKNICPIE